MFILPIKAKYISYGTALITFLTFLAKANPNGAFHFGGILLGYIYFKGPRNIFDPNFIYTKHLEWQLKKKRSRSKVLPGNILAYMMHMLDKAQAAHVPFRRENFMAFGRSVALFGGVKSWFDRINAYGQKGLRNDLWGHRWGRSSLGTFVAGDVRRWGRSSLGMFV
jgi:hypothetical protein